MVKEFAAANGILKNVNATKSVGEDASLQSGIGQGSSGNWDEIFSQEGASGDFMEDREQPQYHGRESLND